MSLRVGIGLFTAQVPPGSGRTFVQEYHDILELVRLAETRGFDSAWVSEHHGSGDGYMPSLLPVLAAMAARTERIALGTGVLLTPLHNPLRLAEDAATVDLLSAGRLILGLGLAWREEEFRMFGVPMRERVTRTVETIEILRRAWTGERFSFTGRVYDYDRVRITPPPAREGGVPILMGGSVPPAIRRAARLADGYLRTRGGGPNRMREDLALLEDAAREAGRDPAGLAFGQLQSCFVWEDGDAWEVVREGAAAHLGIYGGWDEGGDTPDRGFVLASPSEEVMRRVVPAGSSEEIAAALRPMVEAFAGRGDFHLIVRLHYPGMDLDTAARAVELFAANVLPVLRA